MNLLNDAQISGTFFWIVENARKMNLDNSVLFNQVLELISHGKHEIGLHAPHDYQPSLFTRLYGKFNKRELNDAKEELEELTGQPIKLYQPHILLQPATIFFAQQLDLTTILGNLTDCYADAAASPDTQVAKFSHAHPALHHPHLS